MAGMKKLDVLLKLIAVSGELPAGIVKMAVGSDSYAKSLITKLKKEGYISVRYKSGWRGYVLRAKGKRYLMEKFAGDVGFFLTGTVETNHVKSELDKRVRLHRMGMAWVFFYRMDIPIFRSLKPAVFTMGDGLGRRAVGGKDGVYYGSLEFKGCSDKIKGSRACGILLTERVDYVVYNTMEQRMKWAKKTERSMRSWLEGQGMHWGKRTEAEAIILGSSMGYIRELLESDGGIRSGLFQVDDIFEAYYYVPICCEAVVQIRLLRNKEVREAFRHFLGGMLKTAEGREHIVSDGFDGDGNQVYFCYEAELRHLARVKQELGWQGKGKIICLDYQKAAFTEYFGEGVEI